MILIFFFHTENLATEIEVWKDMKKIKHLPAPLSQKKAMRLQYQVKCYPDMFHNTIGFIISISNHTSKHQLGLY